MSWKHQILYKQAGKCDEHQQFKDILEAAMVSTPEGLTDNNPISSMTQTPVEKPSARKSLCLYTRILDVKKKTATHRFGSTKNKWKAIKYGTKPWTLNKKRKWDSKINDQINKSLYNWIMHHPQVVQSPIFNDCLKVKMDGHNEP